MSQHPMYLLDTNVISELRKQQRANPGVQRFFSTAIAQNFTLYLSVVTIGEMRRGVDLIRYRGDTAQADRLEAWLQSIIREFSDFILDFTINEAQVWGNLRVPHPQNAIDKQLAATALTHGLILVTRNIQDFQDTGVVLLNPFR
ncbi:MAG: type II toxin-antitoxin system VapC family toxin [Prochlorothrix sp.]|nr:type II toxin-antitoxin system VapC family toxin [Prochlorothrix sp.]